MHDIEHSYIEGRIVTTDKYRTHRISYALDMNTEATSVHH